MAKSKKRPAEETAARPHRVTVILTVAGILATIGVGWFFKASAQTTAVNGGVNGGAIIGINHGTVVAPPATKPCQTAGVHVEGGANIEFKHFGTFGFDCGVDIQNSRDSKFEDFLARR